MRLAPSRTGVQLQLLKRLTSDAPLWGQLNTSICRLPKIYSISDSRTHSVIYSTFPKRIENTMLDRILKTEQRKTVVFLSCSDQGFGKEMAVVRLWNRLLKTLLTGRCRGRLGLTGFRRRFQGRFRKALVQSSGEGSGEGFGEGSGEGSGEGLGGFGAEPGQVQQDLQPFNSRKPS